MASNGETEDRSAVRDGVAWRIGNQSDVAWIAAGTEIGKQITSAIPAVFDAYATIDVPPWDGESAAAGGHADHRQVLIEHLARVGSAERWWLGYLDTGAADADLVFPDAPRVRLYANWNYVLVLAGAKQALTWREEPAWNGAIPDLLFPEDRSWLLSTLWDDDWRCIGGTTSLIQAIVGDPRLAAREVQLGTDATPPGHVAI